jgi:hypothetical protein
MLESRSDWAIRRTAIGETTAIIGEIATTDEIVITDETNTEITYAATRFS